MEYIALTNTIIKTNQIRTNFDVSENLKKYFSGLPFYLSFNVDVSDTPLGIAAIPFVANVLPLIWITDAELRIPVLDKSFYESINDFKEGYCKMYPDVKFGGKIIVDKIEDNSYLTSNDTALLFSGGLDAYHTLIRHKEEKPSLITIFGADLHLTDVDGWNETKRAVTETGYKYSLPNIFIESSFSDFFNNKQLNKDFYNLIHGYWYHNVQHGIGLLSLTAPYLYKLKTSTLYIASSYYRNFPDKIYCASDESIDSRMRIASCRIVHDAYESTRQNKIQDVIEYSKTNNESLYLRVCWFVKDGKNCCRCEKCYRTIMGIIAEAENPEKFGLKTDDETLTNLREMMTIHYQCGNVEVVYWEDIKKRYQQNAKRIKSSNYDVYKKTKWIKKFNFYNLKANGPYKKKVILDKSFLFLYKITPRPIIQLLKSIVKKNS